MIRAIASRNRGCCAVQPFEDHHFSRHHLDPVALHSSDRSLLACRSPRAHGVAHKEHAMAAINKGDYTEFDIRTRAPYA
jgi:hypothetical protein